MEAGSTWHTSYAKGIYCQRNLSRFACRIRPQPERWHRDGCAFSLQVISSTTSLTCCWTRNWASPGSFYFIMRWWVFHTPQLFASDPREEAGGWTCGVPKECTCRRCRHGKDKSFRPRHDGHVRAEQRGANHSCLPFDTFPRTTATHPPTELDETHQSQSSSEHIGPQQASPLQTLLWRKNMSGRLNL